MGLQSASQAVSLGFCIRLVSLLLGLFFSITPSASLAHPASSDAVAAEERGPSNVHAAEHLTKRLHALITQYKAADLVAQAWLLPELLKEAATRHQHVRALIETDPGAVLRMALPARLRAGLPPEVQVLVEEETEEEGTLEVLHEDRVVGSRYRYFLKTAAGRLSLHFAAKPPALQTGAQVRAHGVRLSGAMALGTSVTTVTIVQPNTFGEQKTLVILVNFQDNPIQPYTSAYAAGVAFTDSKSASNFYRENSYQQTWLAGDVVGWFTIAQDSTVCDFFITASLADQAAAAAGANLAAYSRHVYVFPQNACGWWGQGTVGGNPAQAWINGSLQLRVVGHELGHNFGLYHSHALDCGDATLGLKCTPIEYGDMLDIMGSSSDHINAFQKERLGWLNYAASPPITIVDRSGTYWLEAYESASASQKALKLLRSTDPTTGAKTWYYLETRRGAGFDSDLAAESNALTGFVVHLGTDLDANSSNILDMTPDTSSWYDPALAVGQTFTDSVAGVTLFAISADASGGTVNVSFVGSVSCVHANPTVTVWPSATQWVQPGATVTYTVTVTNTDSSDCSTSSFTLQASAPVGWMAGFGSSSVTLNPGASGSTSFTVTSPATAAGGFYTIGVTATNSANTSFVGSASVTESLVTSLSVSVTTDQSIYTGFQWVTVSATVMAGQSPTPNASVTFTITKPSRAVLMGTATTGANGLAVFRFRLKPKDITGQWQVQAIAAANGLSGSGTTSFMVQ